MLFGSLKQKCYCIRIVLCNGSCLIILPADMSHVPRWAEHPCGELRRAEALFGTVIWGDPQRCREARSDSI